MHLRSLILLVAAASVGASAAATPIIIKFSGPASRAIAVRATHGADERSVECVRARDCVLDLSTGAWTLDYSVVGKWIAPTSIDVATAPQTIASEVFDAGNISGRIQLNEKMSESIGVTFEAPVVPHVEVQCPVRDDRWTCSAPATALDIRLHIPGFVSRYVWGARVEAGKTTDTGTLLFKRGASLIGRAEVGRGLRANVAEADVTLRPRGDTRNVPAAIHLHPRANGFFQFDGVPPGQFELTATLRNMTTDVRRVTIVDGYEAQLRSPLVLDNPRRAEILMSPPMDPWLERWSIEVLQVLDDGHLQSAGSATAFPDGRWSSPPLRSANYRFAVHDHEGNLWSVDDARIDGADISRTIVIPVKKLTGTIRLGEKPIEGDLTFQTGSSSIRVHSDDSGAFRGFIVAPEEAKWSVRVESKPLLISRTISDVRVTKHDEKNEVEASLTLPSTSIGGVVVSESGASVARAIVELSERGGNADFIQTQANNGAFTLNGLEPGEYLIRAESYDLRASDSVPITIASNGDNDDVRLVVKPKHDIEISVDSPAGPIPAAKLWLVPTDQPASISYPVTTDAQGKATALLPPSSRAFDIRVDAPGFSVDQFHVEFERARLAIHMQQNGGRLRLALPAPNYEADAPQALLVHKGAVFNAYAYGRWTPDGDSGYVVAPDVDPGAWTLCLVPGTQRASIAGRMASQGCTSGTLASHGTLTLTAAK